MKDLIFDVCAALADHIDKYDWFDLVAYFTEALTDPDCEMTIGDCIAVTLERDW